MKPLFVVLRVLVLVVLGLYAYAFIIQEKLLYPIPSTDYPDELPYDVEKINIGVSYGLFLEPLASYQVRNPLIIFTHGNAERAADWVDEFDAIREKGFSVLILEYPGYAGAAGSPDKTSISETVLKAYDLMAKRPDIDDRRIVAYGRSIGGGAASILAAERPLAALCLESTFSSLPTLVSQKGFPGFLLRDRYDNQSIIADLDIPIIIFHGRHDTLIPISHAETLAHAAAATYVTLECGHNNCPRPWQELYHFTQTVFQ